MADLATIPLFGAQDSLIGTETATVVGVAVLLTGTPDFASTAIGALFDGAPVDPTRMDNIECRFRRTGTDALDITWHLPITDFVHLAVAEVGDDISSSGRELQHTDGNVYVARTADNHLLFQNSSVPASATLASIRSVAYGRMGGLLARRIAQLQAHHTRTLLMHIDSAAEPSVPTITFDGQLPMAAGGWVPIDAPLESSTAVEWIASAVASYDATAISWNVGTAVVYPGGNSFPIEASENRRAGVLGQFRSGRVRAVDQAPARGRHMVGRAGAQPLPADHPVAQPGAAGLFSDVGQRHFRGGFKRAGLAGTQLPPASLGPGRGQPAIGDDACGHCARRGRRRHQLRLGQ